MMGPHLISRFNSGGSGSSHQFHPRHTRRFLLTQEDQAMLCGGQSVPDLRHAFVACHQPQVRVTCQHN
jgi:hypothetical protein